MSKYLSSGKLDKINHWLFDMQNAPILLHPLHSVVQESTVEFPPNVKELRVPTFHYDQAIKKKQVPKWKSERLQALSRRECPLRGNMRAYYAQSGLDSAFRPELNTVESLVSLPNPETNELVTDSRSVLQGEFVRVLHIRNSFYAEHQISIGLLSQQDLSPASTILYEMRQSECLYGCEKAQAAADFIRSYAKDFKLSIDFASLLAAFPYPEATDGDRETFSNLSPATSPTSTIRGDVSVDTTAASSSGKVADPHKEAISEADFKNWKDRWVFQSQRAMRHPGTL